MERVDANQKMSAAYQATQTFWRQSVIQRTRVQAFVGWAGGPFHAEEFESLAQ